MSKLSVIIPTLNVVSLLEDCLKSVAFADEVIVVDMNSTDGTADIARKFPNVRLISNFPKDGNFTVNRQLGFQLANHEWLLKLDSDERLMPELQEEIKAFLADPARQKARGYFFKVRLYMFGKLITHGMPRYEIRLFHKDSFEYGAGVHDQIKINGPTGVFKNPYMHFNHRSIFQWLEKMNYYTEYDLDLALENNIPMPLWKILVTPVYVFWVSYLARLGFLEGVHGLVIAVLLAYYAFVEKAKIWEANYKKTHRLSF